LIAADNGWIFRKALYYRGAIQSEDEAAKARELLLELSGQDVWSSRGIAPLRIGASFLEHGVETRSVARVRQLSLALSEKDEKFLPLRIKIHNQPDREDAARVRDYAAGVRDPELAAQYARLADEIDKVFASESASKRLKDFKKIISSNPILARKVAATLKTLETTADPVVRFGDDSRTAIKYSRRRTSFGRIGHRSGYGDRTVHCGKGSRRSVAGRLPSRTIAVA
jgi:hypothetical protein